MNYKRAALMGIMLWVLIFTVLSILMFMPFLAGKIIIQYIIFWVLLVPITLLLAKWYFKMDSPNIKKGFILGLLVLAVSTIFDLLITVPIFVKSYAKFFGDWKLHIGVFEMLFLCTYAGWEFDGTYTKPEIDASMTHKT